YKAPIDSTNHIIGRPQKIRGSLKKRFHDADAVFTKDGKTIYFTRSNYTSGKKNNKTGIHLKIYRARKKEGKWQKPEDLSINSDEFSTAHPALSPDGKKLFFASDRPGTLGQSD